MRAFDPSSEAGGHALRVAARVCALSLLPRTGRKDARHDEAGLEEADVEAGSHTAWKAWVRSLDRDDSVLLRIWRCGAVRTPTRTRHRSLNNEAKCAWCDCLQASARHFWQECPRFEYGS